jgi:hypothetical protein
VVIFWQNDMCAPGTPYYSPSATPIHRFPTLEQPYTSDAAWKRQKLG